MNCHENQATLRKVKNPPKKFTKENERVVEGNKYVEQQSLMFWCSTTFWAFRTEFLMGKPKFSIHFPELSCKNPFFLGFWSFRSSFVNKN